MTQFFDRPWDSQPQEAVGVDFGNPLARGLISAVIGGQRFDAFGRRIAFTGTSVSPGQDGLRTVTNGSSDYAYIDIAPQTLTAATVWALTVPTTVALDATIASLGRTSTSQPTIPLRAGNATASKLQKWVRGDAGGSISGTRDSSTAAFVAGSRAVVSLSVALNGGSVDAYINGQLDASATTSAAATSTVDRIGLGVLYAAGNFNPGAYGSSLFLFYNRVLSADEQRALYLNPWQLFAPRRIYIPGAVAGGAGAQSLTPTLYSNAQTFYTPTVSAGATSLAPALYSNAQTFYAPTVTRGAVSLAPTLYSNAQAFYSATVTQGAVLAPALYSNSQSFYAATVSAGAVTLTPALYSNAQSFYSATVLNAGQILAPDLYSNAQAFYAPTVGVGAVTLTPALFTNSSTFYAASVSDGAASGFIKYFDVLSGRLLILRAL